MALGVSKRVEGFSHSVSSGLLWPILGWSSSPSFTCKTPSCHVLLWPGGKAMVRLPSHTMMGLLLRQSHGATTRHTRHPSGRIQLLSH